MNRTQRRLPRRTVKAVITNKGVKAVAPAVAKPAPSRQLATLQQVKRMISGSAENKLAGLALTANFNQTISAPSDIYGLLPALPQGTNDNQRIGNRITPKGLRVAITLSINSEVIDQGVSILPRLFVMSCKSIKFQPNISGIDETRLLDYGTGEHTFTGNQWDYMSPVNKDYVVVHKDIKTKLCENTLETNGIFSRTFIFTVKCPKTLDYNDGQSYPNNFAPFMCLAYARGDGAVEPLTTLGLHAEWTSTLYYEDS